MAACFCRAARECRSDHLAPENPAVLGFPPRGTSRFPAPFPIPADLPRKIGARELALIFLCRAAGNRTRSLRTPCARTTGILRPAFAEASAGKPALSCLQLTAFQLLLTTYYLLFFALV